VSPPAPAAVNGTTSRLVVYTTSWAQYRNGSAACIPFAYKPGHIDPFVPTHVIYAFAVISSSYQVRSARLQLLAPLPWLLAAGCWLGLEDMPNPFEDVCVLPWPAACCANTSAPRPPDAGGDLRLVGRGPDG
jgi:hypothetical protein